MSEFEFIETFSDNLQSIIKEQGISQNQLARKAKLSQGTISKILNRQSMPSVKVVVNLAYALGLSMDELIDLGDIIE